MKKAAPRPIQTIQPMASGTLGVRRVFALLRVLASHNRDGMRLVDIARRLNLELPTAHRILKCLVVERALRRDDATRRYHLGPEIFELGIVAAPHVDMREICGPALKRLAEQTEDTVFLTQRSNVDAVCLCREEGKFPVKTFTLEVGMRRPLGVGAGSLAILSALPKPEIKRVIQANANRLRDYDELTPASLMAQVRRSQRLTYAVRDLRGLGGVRTVGVVIRSRNGTPFAALSLSAITSRMKDERIVELAAMLKSEALQIEKQLAGVQDLE